MDISVSPKTLLALGGQPNYMSLPPRLWCEVHSICSPLLAEEVLSDVYTIFVPLPLRVMRKFNLLGLSWLCGGHVTNSGQ